MPVGIAVELNKIHGIYTRSEKGLMVVTTDTFGTIHEV